MYVFRSYWDCMSGRKLVLEENRHPLFRSYLLHTIIHLGVGFYVIAIIQISCQLVLIEQILFWFPWCWGSTDAVFLICRRNYCRSESPVLQGSLSPICRACIENASVFIGPSTLTFSLYIDHLWISVTVSAELNI